MAYDIERVADTRCHTGEGPTWHPDEDALYWTDIPNGRLYRYDPAANDYERLLDGDRPIGGLTVQADGSLLLFRGEGVVERYADGDTEHVTTVEHATHTRFNDVVADPEGRVYAGTMPADGRLGSLYRIDTDGAVETVVEDDFDIPNGMDFPDDDTMYLTESEARRIYAYDYDRATGALSNRRTFIDVTGEAGIPDGMVLDADGDLWSARWDGGAVVRYDADGAERGRVEFPARKVSCIAFGGRDYADAYVTTALDGGDRAAEGDGAGALFRFDAPAGVTGRPEFRSTVSL